MGALMVYLAMIALPHDAQRIVTLLKEQEALTQQRQRAFTETIEDLLPKMSNSKKIDPPTQEQLKMAHEKLLAVIETADEKVSLARHLHQLVRQHVRHLEDEICCFEEEVRLARKYGELDEVPPPVEFSYDEGGRKSRRLHDLV